MVIYMHIDPGQGYTIPLDQTFFINKDLLMIWSFAAIFSH